MGEGKGQMKHLKKNGCNIKCQHHIEESKQVVEHTIKLLI
jgi:hypothetical protein